MKRFHLKLEQKYMPAFYPNYGNDRNSLHDSKPQAWTQIVSDATICCLIAALAVPETFFADEVVRFAGVPVYSVLAGILFLVVVIESQAAERPPITWIGWIVLVSVWLILLGVVQGNDSENVARDFLFFSCFFSGLLFGNLREVSQIQSIAIKLALFCLASLILTMIFFELGLVPGGDALLFDLTTRERVRVTLNSVARCENHLIIIVPFLFLLDSSSRRHRYFYNSLILCCILSLILEGFWSSTKSALVKAMFLTMVWLRSAWIERPFASILPIVLLALVMPVAVEYASETQLFERVVEYNIKEEGRLQELQDMLAILSGSELTGLGWGCVYMSTYLSTGEVVGAAYPHLGALNFLLKGGFFLFLVCVLVPVGYSVVSFLSPRTRRTPDLAVVCAVLGYAVIGMGGSGGAYYGELFLYGVMVALLARMWRKSPT